MSVTLGVHLFTGLEGVETSEGLNLILSIPEFTINICNRCSKDEMQLRRMGHLNFEGNGSRNIAFNFPRAAKDTFLSLPF